MYRFATAVLLAHTFSSVAAAQPTFLNITAIAGVQNQSVIQCWQMESPFAVSNDAGTKGVARIDLSDTHSLSYLVLPSNYDGGLHTAPAKQYVISYPLFVEKSRRTPLLTRAL
jgi:hypothetical protein